MSSRQIMLKENKKHSKSNLKNDQLYIKLQQIILIIFYKMKSESRYSLEQLFSNLAPFLKQGSPFADSPIAEDWYDTVMESLSNFQILVVGAGGLGCEIVKNLALSGFRQIHLIDMDTIDLTNLNRQFLFRQKDIGKKKAEVVAQFIMNRCPGVQVIPHTCKVQQKQFKFYTKFSVIIGGLDNVEARKFLNSMVHQLNLDEDETQCFYIDGATQGFEGQCIVVEPFKSSCYNCSLFDNLINNQPKNNYCTIANTPRTPQHCIQYVLEVEWQKNYPHTKRDNDNLEHMQWIYQKSLERAKAFRIQGVTEMLTLGLAKNIIPAIASTNALIAAFSTNEALKISFATNPFLKNYFFYRGGTSTGSESYVIEKKYGCIPCSMKQSQNKPLSITMSGQSTFGEVLQQIHKVQNLITDPFVFYNKQQFFNPFDPQRRQRQKQTTLNKFAEEGIFCQTPFYLIITDPNLKSQQEVIVTVTKNI